MTEEKNNENALKRVSCCLTTQLMPHADLSQISETHIDHCHLSISRPKKKNCDLRVLEVLIHVIEDTINNVDVIISALMI